MLVVLGLLLGGRYLVLFVGVSGGDVPSVSALDLPPGTEIVDEQKSCASGGCWVDLTVRPPEGTTAPQLAEQIGATPQAEIHGTLLDPRTIWMWGEPRAEVLELRVDFFSGKWVP